MPRRRPRLSGARLRRARLGLLVAAGLASVTVAGPVAALVGPPATGTATASADPATPGRYAGIGGGPAGPGAPCAGPLVVCQGRILFGLSTPDARDLGPDLRSLESGLDRRATLVGSYQDFTEPLYVDALNTAIAGGRVPLITWEPFRASAPTTDSFPLAAIAAGTFDTYLRARAAEARQVRGDVVVRFGHEMNGFWYPWGQPRPLNPQSIAPSDNTPARYVAAYRHVVDVFRDAGARNVRWMWSPNLVDANPNVTLASLYPGDAYVDVVGLSGYLMTAAQTYASRFPTTLAAIAQVSPGKPVIVAETGVARSDSRIDQLAGLVEGLASSPEVVGFVYFSQPDQNVDYELTGDQAAIAALAEDLRRSQVESPYGETSALADAPRIGSAATPLVGQTLTSTLSWRGRSQGSTITWLSCPTATADAQCRPVGHGWGYTLGPGDHGRFLLATLGLVSTERTDVAASATVGPVKTDPPPVPVLGIDLITGAQRLRFGSPADGVTNWIISLDAAAPVYLPSSTAEYFIKNLAAGSTHTLALSSCDCPWKGPVSSLTFGVVTKPGAAAVAVSGSTASVSLPAPQPSQTAWAITLDGGPARTTGVDQTTYVLSGLSAGNHVVGVARVAGDGRTSAATTSFTSP